MGETVHIRINTNKKISIFTSTYIMHPCVFTILSLTMLRLVTVYGYHQLVAVEEGGGDDTNGVMNKCLDMERHALLLFKAPLQDPDGSLSTWRPNEHDCCQWKGVTCNNQTGHVTELDISDYNLRGEISHSLLNLSYLNFLDLSYNSFCGTIPAFFGSMARLRDLKLNSNNLNGTVPKSIGSLTKLRYLDLSYNSFYGTIPPEFGNLTNLQYLYLGVVGRCRVENLQWLSHLSHLQQLGMDGISLAKQNHWVDVILSLRKLSYLSLDGCELSQVMYPYSSSFLNSSSSSIQSLYLGNNSLNSSMYHWLLPLTSNKLHFLDLSSNMLDGIPKYLGSLCSLVSLRFDSNSAVVKFPGFLSNLSGCTSLTLQELDASYNQFIGSLSDDIQKFSSLRHLWVSHNHLNGIISDKVWELPMLEEIDVSSNSFRGAISKNIGKSKAFEIYLSENQLQGVPSTDHMSKLSYVQLIDMNSCNLGPHFPKWVQTLRNLTRLHIANSKISDKIPMEFWDTWPSQLRYLNLSSNNISGEGPDLSSNFDNGSVIDLSSNSFSGPLSNVSSTLALLNLSRNKFSGGISFLCQMVDGFLEVLDLSHNLFTGKLPDCLWHLKLLKVLNLGHNNLSRRLPPSIGYLRELEVLDLYKNNFSGELPLSLKNCTSLNLMNLGANKFSGYVPVWIGENLSRLYGLILRSNNFFGTIPLQLCYLANLQILDLSMNNLQGTIPSCLNNLTSMVQEGFLSPPPNIYSILIDWIMKKSGNGYSNSSEYADHMMIEWQGSEREFTRNLGLLKTIDLSSNNLTGQIPHELMDLYDLIALNLSKNCLLGEIPLKIGQMKQLLALDLSRNILSGGIPSSMSQMSLLNYLDVSFNNLSGRIPTSTQLQSFEPSRYDGNAALCGPPLSKKCQGDEESKVPLVVGKSEGEGGDVDEVWNWFHIGEGCGFATGFWIACGALLVNSHGRRVFFHFYDGVEDWVYG
ncbi:receptor-like protein EIX2 [Lactuca sativa]|nr:receptor-like protein EIX2 [Lactuca sativa]